MKSVYGKRLAADAGARETWMDLFTQLEPDGGFHTVVVLSWSRSASSSNGESRLNSPNGRIQTKPVYGQKSRGGARDTWMDRFTQMEPDGGFRAAVEWAWNSSTPTSDESRETLAA